MSVEKLLEAHTAQDREQFDKIDARLARIEDALAKQRGFLAGIVFVVSAIFAVVTLFGQGLITWLRG